MRHLETFTHRKRTFLAPVSTGFTSYFLAEVESSKGGTYDCGHYMLTLADCHRQIRLEFPLYSARHRRNSLAKINLLIEMLIDFGTALQKEAQLIADYRPRTLKKGQP